MSLPAARVAELGQSIWYDNLSRDLFASGEMRSLVEDQGVRGVTSNPAIFKKAMTTSPLYAPEFDALAREGKSATEIYETLAVEDIRTACDLLREVFDGTEGKDGFVSLEVSPALAHDTDGTVADALRLAAWVDRPNLMIKVPATPEGIPAIRSLISAGLSINVTLIFSREMYARVIDAYMSGLEDRAGRGEPLAGIQSVASFFVSRVDSAVDAALDQIAADQPDVADEVTGLKGRAAVANAKLAYELFGQEFGAPRFDALSEKGASVQRPLWASTSTKDPSYPDTLYVDTLIGRDTVNTIPPKTLAAFNDHGTAAATIMDGMAEAGVTLDAIERHGIAIDGVCEDLLAAGVKSFADSFDELLAAVEARRRAATSVTAVDGAAADATTATATAADDSATDETATEATAPAPSARVPGA